MRTSRSIHRVLAALVSALAAGCYASHAPGSSSPSPTSDAAIVDVADASSVEPTDAGTDPPCRLPLGSAYARFAEGRTVRMEALAFIATGILELDLTTAGGVTVGDCTIMYQPGLLDRVSMVHRGAREPGTYPVGDCAGCVAADVITQRPFISGDTGEAAQGGELTFTALGDLPGDDVCAAFTLRDADGREIASGELHTALMICDR